MVKPGDTVAIVGAGPVGLAVLLTAQFFSPCNYLFDRPGRPPPRHGNEVRATTVINSADGKAVEKIMELTGGEGVNVAIEAVGTPATFDICQGIVGVGGHLANVGVHGKPVALHMEKLWDHNITLTTRLVGHRDPAHALEGRALRQAAARQTGPRTASRWETSRRPTTPSATPPARARSRS